MTRPGPLASDPPRNGTNPSTDRGAQPTQSERACDSTRRDYFGEIAAAATRLAGGRWAFLLAVLSVVIWGALGPYARYSDHWQIVINTGTTIVTFLMVFLIQNSQNRESKAIQLKLDELLYSIRQASNTLINVENLSEEELDRLGKRYKGLADRSRRKLEEGLESVGREVKDVEQEVHEVEGRVTDVEKKVDERSPK